ncbi:MAG: hypothetical protein WCC64_21060 [Aliidongia sp.]
MEPASATAVTVTITYDAESEAYEWIYNGPCMTGNNLYLPDTCQFVLFVLDEASAAQYSFSGGESSNSQLAFPFWTAGYILMTDAQVPGNPPSAPVDLGTPTLWAVPNDSGGGLLGAPFSGGPEVTNTGSPIDKL